MAGARWAGSLRRSVHVFGSFSSLQPVAPNARDAVSVASVSRNANMRAGMAETFFIGSVPRSCDGDVFPKPQPAENRAPKRGSTLLAVRQGCQPQFTRRSVQKRRQINLQGAGSAGCAELTLRVVAPTKHLAGHRDNAA